MLLILTILCQSVVYCSTIHKFPEIKDGAELDYVFEIVRHGARTPIGTFNSDYFSIKGEGLLTSSGMRERYLMGKYNRERYIENYALLDPVYNPNQFIMESTDVFRTI